jgi:mannose-6-phosphate isomerase-like protein (cupin superfamily)
MQTNDGTYIQIFIQYVSLGVFGSGKESPRLSDAEPNSLLWGRPARTVHPAPPGNQRTINQPALGDHGFMTDFIAAYVVPAGSDLTGDPGLKASYRSTGGAISVFETSIGTGPPLHVHEREDECFFVLDGELSVRCGGDAFDAGTGSFVFLPRGRPHRFWSAGQPCQAAPDRCPGRH